MRYPTAITIRQPSARRFSWWRLPSLDRRPDRPADAPLYIDPVAHPAAPVAGVGQGLGEMVLAAYASPTLLRETVNGLQPPGGSRQMAFPFGPLRSIDALAWRQMVTRLETGDRLALDGVTLPSDFVFANGVSHFVLLDTYTNPPVVQEVWAPGEEPEGWVDADTLWSLLFNITVARARPSVPAAAPSGGAAAPAAFLQPGVLLIHRATLDVRLFRFADPDGLDLLLRVPVFAAMRSFYPKTHNFPDTTPTVLPARDWGLINNNRRGILLAVVSSTPPALVVRDGLLYGESVLGGGWGVELAVYTAGESTAYCRVEGGEAATALPVVDLQGQASRIVTILLPPSNQVTPGSTVVLDGEDYAVTHIELGNRLYAGRERRVRLEQRARLGEPIES